MTHIHSEYTDKDNYYNKILELDTNINYDRKKDIYIKDIDHMSPLVYTIGSNTHFDSLASILDLIAKFYPNIIVNDNNEILIKYIGTKYLIIEFRICSIESRDDLVSLRADTLGLDYISTQSSKLHDIIYPRGIIYGGIKTIKTHNDLIDYNKFFSVILDTIRKLVELYPYDIQDATIKDASTYIYRVYRNTFGHELARWDIFNPSIKHLSNIDKIKHNLELIKSKLITDNGNYVLEHPNPFSEPAQEIIRFNLVCISLCGFILSSI